MRPEQVAIYARYSTDRQDARSIEDQLRRCRAFAKANGLEVVEEYADAAASGATLHREGLQRLLTDARRRGGSPFRAVLVDDLSRLSRDLLGAMRIAFEDLTAVGVRVIDCTTGMPSDREGARLMFGALALVNDQLLESVRKQTHRGLEGRALGGFWTGGRVYGYATITEPTPSDPEHPRKLVVINEDEARVVRRVFDLFLAGTGLKSIAATLNAEGVPAPYDPRTKLKTVGRGWGHTTIRAMLLNERYAGTFVWNKRKFIRIPGKKNRRAIMRPRSEWITKEFPELAIVSPEVWSDTCARFLRSTSKAPRGRPPRSAKHVYLVSGLLRCGACNGPMGVIGARTENGRRWPTYGCSANRSRGDAVCSNNLTVSEKKATAAVIAALERVLTSPEYIQKFVQRFNARLAELQRAPQDEGTRRLEQEVAEVESRIQNLTGALAKVGWSEALGDQLKAEEARLTVLKRQRAANVTTSDRAKLLPHPKAVEGYVRDLLRTLSADPERGRDILLNYMGGVWLTPKGEGPDRYYLATGAFNLAAALSRGGELIEKQSCGGRI